MKKNRRVSKKLNVNTVIATHFGAVIAFLFVMVILNLLASSSCQHLKKAIGEDEKTLARLDDDYDREATRWEEMKTAEKVEMALLRHGLAMKPQRAEQNIIMQSDGQPKPGQHSVAMAKRRVSNMGVASVSAATRPSVVGKRRR